MSNQSNDPKDYMSIRPRPGSAATSTTHTVENVVPELPDQNLYRGDQVLLDAVKREEIDWITDRATTVGEMTGSYKYRELARLANTEKPILRTHDRVGNRIDHVDFHPSYHEIAAATYSTEVHSLPWTVNEKRPQTARNVLYYMWNQVENGIVSCGNGMTWSIVPVLQSDPDIGKRWLSKIISTEYDPRLVPASEKSSITAAMAMTEKQGGSDLRTNSTRAVPTGNEREYLLTGHKYFVSAPMNDIILVTAQTEKGLTLFIAPRVLDNGDLNNISILRLKDKLGNISNASSEMELNGAVAYRIGEEGRGVRQFVKHMTHYIRMALSTGSAGIMRSALTQALHHTTHRKAFGATVRHQPMMQNTLADLAIESEAALLLGMRVARAVDDTPSVESENALNRILIPIAKYWNCRRTSSVTLEAMECHGGLGYIEEQPVSMLYREAPLNSVWEGTSAMMGLDVMRALEHTPDAKDALMDEIKLAQGADRHFDNHVKRLEVELVNCASDFEPHARRVMTMIAQAVQASLLIRQSIPGVADAFCASRLGGEWAHEFGTLKQTGVSLRTIVDRAVIS